MPRLNGRRLVRVAIRFLGLVLILTALYLGYLSMIAPRQTGTAAGLHRTQPAKTEATDMLLEIPKAGVRAGIVSGPLSQLDKGLVVQRTRSGGDPEKGGNFVLTGHRFVFDLSPQKVHLRSVFYDLDKLAPGDKIAVAWRKQRYNYVVRRTYLAKPTQLEVEAPSAQTILTLYTCTLAGSSDGRVVVEAVPL